MHKMDSVTFHFQEMFSKTLNLIDHEINFPKTNLI